MLEKYLNMVPKMSEKFWIYKSSFFRSRGYLFMILWKMLIYNEIYSEKNWHAFGTWVYLIFDVCILRLIKYLYYPR